MNQPAKKTNTNLAPKLWIGFSVVFLSASLGMAALAVMSGKQEREAALEKAKRLEFTPDFSKVSGKLLRLEDLEKAKGSKENPSIEPAPETTTPEEKPDPLPEGSKKPEEETQPEVPPAKAEPEPAKPAQPEEHPAEETPAHTTPPAEEHPAPVETPTEHEPAPAEEPAASHPAPAEPAHADPVQPAPIPVDDAPLSPVETKTDAGIVPTVGQDGAMAWKHFSRKSTAASGGASANIAIVLYGLGQGSLTTESALALPADISLSFSPYSRDLSNWVGRARASGHEILLDLPMETDRYPAMDPGPYGILNALSVEENDKRLVATLVRTRGYVGLLMPLGETISDNGKIIAPLVTKINQHGLLMLSSESDTSMPFSQAASRSKTPILHADIVLDGRITEAHILGQLTQLETLAKKQGFALAIGRSFPVTVEQVSAWSKQLAGKGITLVPVTALAN